jgi:hypothetical protein
MGAPKPPKGSSEDGEPGGLPRRRWEELLPREEIMSLLAERRWADLLARLREARARWPRDLELLRSVRVIEDHLKARGEDPG